MPPQASSPVILPVLSTMVWSLCVPPTWNWKIIVSKFLKCLMQFYCFLRETSIPHTSMMMMMTFLFSHVTDRDLRAYLWVFLMLFLKSILLLSFMV